MGPLVPGEFVGAQIGDEAQRGVCVLYYVEEEARNFVD
jgi:hypothetical protein